jgi:hypothetical protein
LGPFSHLFPVGERYQLVQGFPATVAGDVRDPRRARHLLFPAMQVQAVRFTDLHYFLSQTYDAFLDGILHDKRLAEHAERITVARAAAFLSGAVVGSVVCSIPCLLLVAPYGQTLSHKWIAPALGRFLHVLSELPVAGSSYILANWLTALACYWGCPSDTGITFRYRTFSLLRLRPVK